MPDAARAGDGLGVLLPYQLRWLDLDASRVPVAVWDKSRRVGASWCDACAAVTHAARETGGDCYYQSYSLDMTREYISDCSDWARRLHVAASEIEETVVSDGDRQLLQFSVHLDSGHAIRALPSSPRALRSRGRPGTRYTLDEAAFCDSLPELLKAALAVTMWGGLVRLLSTPNGADSPWNELLEDIRAGRAPHSLQRTTIDDAIADGLARRICSVTGRAWSEDFERGWRDRLFAAYRDPDAAAEELLCVPRKSGGAYLSRALIEGAMIDCPVIEFRGDDAWNAAPEPDRRPLVDRWLREEVAPALAALTPERRHAAGFDFARSSHLSVLSLVEIGELRRMRTRLQLEIRNAPHAQQVQILAHVLDRTPRFSGVHADATGAGSYVAEALRDRYGSLAEEVSMTRQWWIDQMPKYRAALEDGDLLIPGTDDVLTDHRALRVLDGVPKLPAATGAGRHGDSLVALALARQAAAEGALPMAGAAAGGRASEDRLAGFGGDPAAIAAAGTRAAARSSVAAARGF